MGRKAIHEKYHAKVRLQKRIINSHNFTYFNFIKILIPYLTRTRKVLDIGCGTGTITIYLASKGKDVLGIDISSKAIKIARENAKNLNMIQKVRFKVTNFPSKDVKGKFDLIILSEVLEHIPNDMQALKNVYKLLKSGGFVIASSPSTNAPLFRMGLLNKFDRDVGHLRRYSLEDFRSLFKNSNFKVVEVYRTEGVIRNLFFTSSLFGKLIKLFNWYISDFINYLDSIAIQIFGESQIYIIAKKL